MNEENENQPAPVETESAPPEQRHQRPRRRFPRRRYRGDRFRRDNSEESPNSSSANADNSGADVAVDTLDQPASGVPREAAEGGGETGEPVHSEPEFGEGIIEISGKGFGFLRDPKRNFVQTPQDIFVTPEIVRRFALRDGMWINGEIRRGSRGPQLTKLLTINGDEPTQTGQSTRCRRSPVQTSQEDNGTTCRATRNSSRDRDRLDQDRRGCAGILPGRRTGLAGTHQRGPSKDNGGDTLATDRTIDFGQWRS